jgi:hypothetical protein
MSGHGVHVHGTKKRWLLAGAGAAALGGAIFGVIAWF